MKTPGAHKSGLLGLLLLMLLPSCVKNEFKIEFEFPKDHIGNYMVSYYAYDKKNGEWMEQTASVQEGQADVDCLSRKPTLICISDASSAGNSIMVYAEPGDRLKISGKDKDSWTWKVSGNKLSERWSEWRNTSASGKADNKKLQKNVEEYVTKHPADELSTLLLLTEWNIRENPDAFVKLWNSLDKKARSQGIIELSGSADLLGIHFLLQADGTLKLTKEPKLKEVVFRSLANGVDTLHFNKASASFLYFFNENNTDRRTAADSLKALTKDYPDSLKRIIADISVDTDSTFWTSTIRRDSLKGVVRAWQPFGLADKEMARLGVVRIPWFIVKDKSGTETYGGTDLAEAMSAFRKAMKKE